MKIQGVAKLRPRPGLLYDKVIDQQYAATCRMAGDHHELNYSTDASSFVLPTAIRPYAEFSRRAFYKDGRFRETTFIVEALTRSACYRKGNAQCASCHDPHPTNPEQNLTSLKFRDNPDQMCFQCQPQYGRSI
jgi:predicted CXXCH cytochrome family protein